MVHLLEREKVSPLMMSRWGDTQKSNDEAFRKGEGDVGISKSTLCRTIQRFIEGGTIKNRPRSGRPSIETAENRQVEVPHSSVEGPRLSIR